MKPVVSIVAPGSMGAAVGQRLVEHGVEVLTSLAGRSAASEARATRAGIKNVPFERLIGANLVLSIVPPAHALDFAEQIASALRSAKHKPVFVDCNAVSPDTVKRIGAVIRDAGAPFVDASIIGGPPKPGYTPRFYAAGEEIEKFTALTDYGLDIRVLDGPIGAASALKMCYAGITKGTTAIATAMILAATRAGAAEALHAEMQESLPMLLNRSAEKVPDMFPKAYRWVAEMLEIAQFASEDSAAAEIFTGISHLYDRMGKDVAGDNREIEMLRQFFKLS